MTSLDALVRRVDELQQRRRPLAFAVAVREHFADSKGGHLAAALTYYSFFSLFPLLLALVSVLGFVLRRRPSWEDKILDSTFGSFPVLGTELRDNVGSLKGSNFAIAVGFALALWSGMRAVYTAQAAMDALWQVQPHERRNFLVRRVRAASMLLLLGGLTLATAVVGGVGTQLSGLPQIAPIATAIGTTVVNIGFLITSYRLLTVARPPLRQLLPGAIAGGIALALLQVAGGWYVTRVQTTASDVYGLFAIVIGLLTWLSLIARITLYGAAINVVRTRRLWPRSFLHPRPPAGPPTIPPPTSPVL